MHKTHFFHHSERLADTPESFMQNKPSDESSETPHTSLRQLSSILAHQHAKPSPLAARKTPISTKKAPNSSIQRFSKAGLTPRSITKNPPTPHTARALQKAAIPLQNTKRLSIAKRSNETPREILRKLSRVLPLYTKKDETNNYPLLDEFKDTYKTGDSEEGTEEIMDAPDIHIPDPEISSDDISPPHLSIPLDQEYTVQSIEMGRRAETRGLNDRLSLERDNDHISIYNEQEMNNTSFDGFSFQNDEILEQENFFKDNINIEFNKNEMIESDPILKIDLMNEKSITITETMPFKDSHLDFSLPELEKSSTKSSSKPSTRSNKPKMQKLSQYGIPLPSLSTVFIKQLVANFTTLKISKDALKEIILASDQFFEQISEDLKAFAAHAGRKTIEDSDVIQLMKRQRQINSKTTLYSLFQKYIPRELESEMPPPSKKSKRFKKN
ncbi:hypothetical protein PORY_000898 [Pneumocystis oryctolagi]|uniref:Uncharacterized protein n=1 Tax=Pneumocystis oryctolagi TaxID=42067 RepID=A0ACB7CG32_9ASCO|nr:hypothetical protein PORY_000898 [Pneumocystis oryctolagi]